MMPERVVVTGLGLASSLGGSPAEAAASLRGGRTGFRESGELPGIPVCPVSGGMGGAAGARLSGWRRRRYLSRGAMWAVLAGLRAAEDSGVDFGGGEGADAEIAGTAAPMLDFGAEPGLPPGDPLDLDALWLLRWLPSTPVSALAALLGVHGGGSALGCACASGLAALGHAWFRLRHGAASLALVACGDSRLSLGGLLGYSKAGVLCRGLPPMEASRPFDEGRRGFVPGEGGAGFALETLGRARARGARVLCEILGFGASLDGGSLAAPDPKGRHARRAVMDALGAAGLAPGDVDWVAAHGTGTLLNDEAEARLLEEVFGSLAAPPAVTALKSWIGHAASASGALEAAICLACAGEGFLPPVRNLARPLPGLPLLREELRSERLRSSVGLVESFGFGGQNAALVLRVGGPPD